MLLWPFNKYPGTDYETFNWEWILKTVKDYTEKVDDFTENMTNAWDTFKNIINHEIAEMHRKFAIYVNVTEEALNTGAIANGAVTAEKLDSTLLWEMLNEYVTPEQYGAAGDGVTDDTSAIQAAIDSGKPVYGFNTYKTVDTLTIDGGKHVYLNEILYDGVNEAVLIGKKNVSLAETGATVKINRLINTGTANTGYGVVVSNIRNSNFYFGRVQDFNTNVLITADGTGTSYNEFEYVYTSGGDYGVVLRATGTGWVNENLFDYIHPTSCINGLVMESVLRLINGNTFEEVCLESITNGIMFNNASHNRINSGRMESVTTPVTYTTPAEDNIVNIDYSSTATREIQMCAGKTNYWSDSYSRGTDAVNIPIFQSGDLTDKIAYNDQYSTIDGCRYPDTGHSYTNNVIGVRENTSHGVRLEGQGTLSYKIDCRNDTEKIYKIRFSSTNPMYIQLKLFNSSNQLITTGTIPCTASGRSFVYDSAAQAHVYNTLEDIERMSPFSLPSEVAYFYLIIKNQNSRQNINNITVYGVNNSSVVRTDDMRLPSVPTYYGIPGEYVIAQDVSGTMGWVWTGAAWVEWTPTA